MPSDDLVKYFIQHTDKKFSDLEEQTGKRFSGLEVKVDKLISFRWMLIGASVGISGLVSVLFQIGMAIAGKQQ